MDWRKEMNELRNIMHAQARVVGYMWVMNADSADSAVKLKKTLENFERACIRLSDAIMLLERANEKPPGNENSV